MALASQPLEATHIRPPQQLLVLGETHCHHPVHGKALEDLSAAAGPEYLNLDRLVVSAQAEVKRKVILIALARTCLHLAS